MKRRHFILVAPRDIRIGDRVWQEKIGDVITVRDIIYDGLSNLYINHNTEDSTGFRFCAWSELVKVEAQ